MYFIYFQYTYNCTPHTHTYTCTVHCTQYLPVYNMFDILHVLHIMVVEFFPHVAWDYTTGCTFEQTLEDRRQKFEEERQSDRTVFSSVHRPRCFAAWLRFEIFEMFVWLVVGVAGEVSYFMAGTSAQLESSMVCTTEQSKGYSSTYVDTAVCFRDTQTPSRSRRQEQGGLQASHALEGKYLELHHLVNSKKPLDQVEHDVSRWCKARFWRIRHSESCIVARPAKACPPPLHAGGS